MQKLVFHPAWDRTISEKDRMKIEETFQQTVHSINNEIKILPLWQAENHLGDLLVTTLIHNKTSNDLSFHNQLIKYVIKDETVATHTFNNQDLLIKTGTSMPWTFIFPEEKWNQFKLNQIGKIYLENL